MNADTNTKRQLMIKYDIKDVAHFAAADDDSIVSEPEAAPFEVMKIAAGEWRSMSSVLKKAWKDRCSTINQLPVNGVFHDVPPVLVSDLNNHVLQSLNYEFDHFSRLFRQALKAKPQVADSIKFKTFGKERFVLGDKIFRSFYFNHLLKLTAFGDWNSLSRLNVREIVQRTRMTRIVHVASKRRLVELFCLNGVCPFIIDDDSSSSSLYCSGGKVFLQEMEVVEKELVLWRMKI
jgi:hypothetical protein